RDKRKTPAAINQGISAVKKLAEECGERGLIGAVEWGGVRSVKRLKQRGVRVGNWLTIEEVEQVLNGTTSRRDKALLALLLGCGLRRDEAAQLRRRHVQIREERMVLVDIVGKGQRTRSVTVPDWAAEPLTKFMDLSTPDQKDDEDGFIFRLTESGVWWVVKETCGRVLKKNRTIAPHDLRRTYARLSVEGKADMRQLQAELGHSSIQTTERYVGAGQKFGKGQGAGDAIAIGKKK
ncbi:MAG TPA: site-specific integrase, partial [Nitrospiraceae bacterium]